MQKEFETKFNEFIADLNSRFENQNTTLIEYEKFFNHAKELFPIYSNFVQQVNDALVTIQELQVAQQSMPQTPVSVKSESPQKSKTVPAPVVHIGEKKKILIVDDAEINRLLMGHLFKNTPTTLEFANSGEQAIEKITRQSFDLILMDLQMKGMSGVETIKVIRDAQPENVKKTKILAITNLVPSEEEKAQAISAGSNEYLSKGMTRDEIKERVISALSLSA